MCKRAILALPPVWTLGVILKFPGPQVPHVSNGDNTWLKGNVSNMWLVKRTEYHLVYKINIIVS